MAFNPPTFNLVCDVWFTPNAPPLAPDQADVPCQLYYPKPTANDQVPGVANSWILPRYLRLPKLTDVRFVISGASYNTIVEVPAGSGRLYAVTDVEDVHKGFPNEYRSALIKPIGTWPVPIP